jgi:hypothetical protein
MARLPSNLETFFRASRKTHHYLRAIQSGRLVFSVKYRSEANFIGEDNMKVFWIFPDGSGGQWDYTLIVK